MYVYITYQPALVTICVLFEYSCSWVAMCMYSSTLLINMQAMARSMAIRIGMVHTNRNNLYYITVIMIMAENYPLAITDSLTCHIDNVW